jgi:hypothetical protein
MSGDQLPDPAASRRGFGFSFGMKDLLALLDKIPIWARLRETPDRVDELEKRVKALEEKPKLPICEKCGVGYVRLDRTESMEGPFAALSGSGLHIKVYKCDSCGMETKAGGR